MTFSSDYTNGIVWLCMLSVIALVTFRFKDQEICGYFDNSCIRYLSGCYDWGHLKNFVSYRYIIFGYTKIYINKRYYMTIKMKRRLYPAKEYYNPKTKEFYNIVELRSKINEQVEKELILVKKDLELKIEDVGLSLKEAKEIKR